MFNDNEAVPLGNQFLKCLKQFANIMEMQTGGRLVQEQDFRLVHQRQGQIESSPHTATVGAYAAVDGLSNEARQKLAAARPVTLGQASRLEGMTPSAVSLLLVHLKKRQLQKSA